MPFYEYECTACKFYVEVLQKISDKPLKQCPSCKKQTMKKLVSAPNFRLKGGGWYETDFKSESEEKRNLADREEAVEAKGEEPKEAKPEEKEAKESKAPKEVKAGGPKVASSKPAARAKPLANVKAKSKAKPKAAAKPVARPKSKSKPKPPAKKK